MEDLDIVDDEVNNIYTVADVCVVCDLYAIKCIKNVWLTKAHTLLCFCIYCIETMAKQWLEVHAFGLDHFIAYPFSSKGNACWREHDHTSHTSVRAFFAFGFTQL